MKVAFRALLSYDFSGLHSTETEKRVILKLERNCTTKVERSSKAKFLDSYESGLSMSLN